MRRTPRGFAFLLAVALAAPGIALAQPAPEDMDGGAPEAAPPVDTAPPAAEAPPHERAIDIRATSEVAGYGDTDHVFVLSPSIAGTISNPTAGWSVDGRYLIDVVSAASVDIVSTASRRWQEVRQAGTFNGAYKPGNTGVAATIDYSAEPDYHALTVGGSVTQDLLAKNLTLLLGYTYGHDIAGRTGTPFSLFSRTLDSNAIKAGATFVLDPSTLLSVVGDLVIENGDPSKPYRYIPMFAPGTAVPKGASIDQVNQLRLAARPLEQLPLSRDRYVLSGRLSHREGESTIRFDERLYRDTWALTASTTDARWLFDLGRRVELGPHARFNIQTPVSFWQRAYEVNPGFDFPAVRTGDRELGPLYSVTGGGSFRWFVGPAANPRTWVVGADFDATSTRYLDDLYITSRLAAFIALSLEVAW